MARFCVHLDGLEFEVECSGDEADAIRTARELNNIGEVRDQRAHRIADLEPVVDDVVVDLVPSGDVTPPSGDGAPPTPPVATGRRRRRSAT